MIPNTITPADARRAEARTWIARLSEAHVSDADHAAFDAWLAQSDAHADAYERELAADYAIEALRGRFVTHPRFSRGSLWTKRGIVAAAALAAAIALFVIIPMTVAPVWSPPVITRVAEVRTVTLPDGSHVTLGARTQYEIAFTDAERRLRLSEGEAYFEIVHDAARPFSVESQGAIIRDVGTAFEVKSSPDRVRVVVTQGAVDVTEPHRIAHLLESPRTVRLTAGQEVSLAPASSSASAPALSLPLPAPHTEAAPWRSGLLVYEDASLAEVVADANRYSQHRITIAGPQLGALRVTAIYPANKVDSLLSGLQATLPLTIQRQANGDVQLTPAP